MQLKNLLWEFIIRPTLFAAIMAVVGYGAGGWKVLLAFMLLLLLAKTVQLAASLVWIWRYGEVAGNDFEDEERRLWLAGLEPEKVRAKVSEFIFGRFEKTEPRWALAGLLEWRYRGVINTWPDPMDRRLGYFLHDLFFRFNSQGILGAMLLVSSAPALATGSVAGHRLLCCAVGVALMVNCFVMATEVLVGNTLMGSRYSRYFHFQFEAFPSAPTPRKRQLHDIISFSTLALVTLAVIAGVCSAYQAMFGGFCGLSTGITGASGWDHAIERAEVWAEFFYFAATTFCTVGFGDIHPATLGTRVLVTAIHALTFGYVLFLLQTLLGQREDVKSSASR
jgi:Ion channel.